jgi:signal transduction histidine kinase
MATILLAEDEPSTRELVKDMLRGRGFEVVSVRDGTEALAKLDEREFDLVLSDVAMPGADGCEVLRRSKQLAPDTEVVIATGVLEHTNCDWIGAGAFELIRKPYEVADLFATIDRALERRQLRAATALYEASRAILDTREPSLLPEVVVSTAYKAMAADDVVLMLPGDDGKLYEACSTALTDSIRAEAREAVENLLPTTEPTIAWHRNVQCIVYPLRTHGMLVISRLINPRPFRKLDLDKAAVLGSQVMLALESVRNARHTIAAERLATVGQVATSIAHEINNPISYVLASQTHLRTQLVHVVGLCAMITRGATLAELRDKLQAAGGQGFAADLMQAVEDIGEGAERVRDIVRDTQSLAMSDQGPTAFNVNEAVRSALRVVAAEIRHKAIVHTNLGDGLLVKGSVGRIAQVFVNLLVNAAEAFQEAAQNVINVESKRVGNHVVVTVSDNGPGIAPPHLPRIFETYYTTKTGPTATGLGLPISRDIVLCHGGEISVDSQVGQGTTFSIVLPLAARTRLPSPTHPPASEKVLPTARLRLLFVDDEPNILRSYKRAFSDHDIVLAEDGEHALAALRENDDFDLILCDLSMPTMSGMRLYEEIRKLNERLLPRIVFATGGSTQRDIEAFLASVTNLVLEKPFEMRVLRKLVADLQRVS